jgi:serine/threonine protein kinase
MTTPQGRYEIIETLGTGATSRVDKARDTLIGRTVALKTFLHGFGSRDVQKQFLREAQIIGSLAHPYIVGLYDVGTDSDGVPYFVMEYVEGKTLERVLDAGPLPLEKAAIWTMDLAAALSRAHRARVIHGDVKPANVLVTKDGQVKLGDFGIARFATQVSSSGTLMGTPAYLSPEQIQGQTQDTRSDLFSLGIILYQITTGVRPFNGSSVSAVCAQIVSITPPPPSHHNPSLPPAFDHIVMRCLEKDPAARYATAEALGASLYPFAHGKDAPAPLSETSSATQLIERTEVWAASAMKSLRSQAEELSRQFPSSMATMWNSKSGWWNRPMQPRDLWVWGAAALVLISLVPIARALRNRGHQTAQVASVTSTPQVLPGASNTAAPTPIISNASMINVSSSLTPDSLAKESANDNIQTDPSSNASYLETSEPLDETTKPVAVRHAFERHRVGAVKQSSTATTKSHGALHDSLPVYTAGTLPSAPLESAAAPVAPQTTLHIDIVSSVADQTLAVYSGEDLLLTTPLRPDHLGDTLRFNCPISAGEHALKVVLYRGDKTVFLHKENNAELRPDGTNAMEVRVNRKSKMLLKHETSLEVIWPSNTTSSSNYTNLGFKPAGALALR